MRTEVDIPDAEYREWETRAASEGKSVKELILSSVRIAIRSRIESPREWDLPNVPSRNPGSLKLGDQGVYEYIPFP